MDAARPWVLEARLAREKLANTPRGQKESELERIAHPRNAQTLRRAIAAVEFLDKLKSETQFPVQQLESFPVAAIEHLLRWYNRDPTGALKAGAKLLRGEHTTDSLGKAERQTRKEIFASTGKALEADYRRGISDFVEQDALAKFSGRASPVKGRKLEKYGQEIRRIVDFAFLDRYERPLIAYIVVGPYRDATLYQRRAFDWVAKANALLNIFQFVCLIIPENGEGYDFIRIETELGINQERLRIVGGQVPKLQARG